MSRRRGRRTRAKRTVDDGLATGATAHAAVEILRAHDAAEVVVAVPVGAPETIARLAAVADRLVCVDAAPSLGAVGAWYRDFDPVSDERWFAGFVRSHGWTIRGASRSTRS